MFGGRVGGRLALPILVAIGFLTLIAVSLASIWLHERAQQDAERALAAHALEAKLMSLLLNLRRAESSRRGYLLSGDPQFLVAYGPTIDAVPPALAEIEAAVTNNPVQREAFAPLKRQVIEEVDELHETIRRYDTGDPAGRSHCSRPGPAISSWKTSRRSSSACRRRGSASSRWS